MNKKYEKMINNFLAEHEQPTAEDLYSFIIDNEWRIYREYEKGCRKEDLLILLEEDGIDRESVPEKLIDSMLETYEDRLTDSDEWHIILNDVIQDYEEDLEEYKGEEYDTNLSYKGQVAKYSQPDPLDEDEFKDKGGEYNEN